ncbi:hypothetical protein GCM10023081_09150 [Arthrobacter ginkgonis]|uniref:Uncharacterized protein n=1 Tax=Arthrobacter ginkgonis TaxID=1630594 RepID=A0ABP7C162_9MICC
MSAEPDAAWDSALTELEERLAATEAWLREHDGAADHDVPSALAAALPAAGWTPPSGLGPVPAALGDRLVALHSRHRDATERLARTRTGVGEALAAARTVLATKAPAPGIYLDLEG